jgi:pyruvate-formate lyase-activating enzyme
MSVRVVIGMNNLLKVVFDMATADIKANRIAFGKRTTMADLKLILRTCLITARKADVH